MRSKRWWNWNSLAEAVIAFVLIYLIPRVVIETLWTFELADRVGAVIAVAFLVLVGIGILIDAFKGARWLRGLYPFAD